MDEEYSTSAARRRSRRKRAKALAAVQGQSPQYDPTDILTPFDSRHTPDEVKARSDHVASLQKPGTPSGSFTARGATKENAARQST